MPAPTPAPRRGRRIVATQVAVDGSIPPSSLGPASVAAPRRNAEEALTIEDYAELLADLEALPSQRNAIFARHGLHDEASRMEALRVWRARVENDRGLHERFEETYRRRRADLAARLGR